ncbi:DUF2381 family protein [Hyalangium sp.]|uniref:DUF2381 family protein n=1 Tax=Hyalangium sp. TaxID=2028555 RepID=UPI002D64C4F4|nr:DUF2381 family protein [Hyalangium sp.]HYI02549.1 DUF2381 family protein [Hyalangium sp.]
MRLCSSAVPLALLVLVTAAVARAQPPPCQTLVRRIELAADPPVLPELCISAGLSTTLLFDQALALDAVELEDRERFERVESTHSLLVLIPSEKLVPGERLRLTVRFTEAGTPASATFVLVVHRGQAERQVEVFRPRSPGSCQAELQLKAAELQSCLEQRALPPPRVEAQASLAGLLMDGVLDGKGITSVNVTSQSIALPPAESFEVQRVFLHRSRSRLVVEVQVKNGDSASPWTAAGAVLLGPPGERLEPFWVLQGTPLGPGEVGTVWVEARASSKGPIGPYTLELWDENKAHTFILKGLKVP